MQRRPLIAQQVRARLSLSLVLGVDHLATRPAGVLDHERGHRPVLGQQLHEHRRETEDRIGRLALGRRDRVRECEESPVDKRVTVDQEYLRRHAWIVSLDLMATPSAQSPLRLRIEMERGPGSLGRVATAIGATGGAIGNIDVIEAGQAKAVRDIIVDGTGPDAAAEIVAALEDLGSVKLLEVTDRTLELHKGGKLFTGLSAPLKTRDDLSMAYTPGVARVCQAIAEDPNRAFEYTIKSNTVAVVSDGSAVLGLGDIGPEAAMPVMEGKCALFKEFGQVDAFPICLDTKDADEIVETVKAIAPGFGGINLEDISSPRCFEIEERLVADLDIPVFHDDQHGTAIVVLAALINALKIVDKKPADLRVLVIGLGAAGVAVTRVLLPPGVKDGLACA